MAINPIGNYLKPSGVTDPQYNKMNTGGIVQRGSPMSKVGMLGSIASGAMTGSLAGPWGAAVGGLIGLGKGIWDRVATRRQNKADKQFSIDMWNAQNSYNAPSAQMDRLKAAGLNPNLAYGQISDAKAGDVSIPNSKALPMPNVEMAFPSTIAQVVDLNGKSLQNDLTEVMIANGIVSGENLRAQGGLYGVDKDIKEQILSGKVRSNKYEESMLETNKEFGRQKLMDIQQRNVYQKLINDAYPVQQRILIQDAWSRLKMSQASRVNINIERMLKQEALKLRQNGVEVNDSFLMRYFGEFIGKSKQVLQSVENE